MNFARHHDSYAPRHGQVIDLHSRQRHVQEETRPAATRSDMADEVRRRLHEHEMAFLELMRAGDVEAASFRAESARILADWLVQHGHETHSLLETRSLGPIA